MKKPLSRLLLILLALTMLGGCARPAAAPAVTPEPTVAATDVPVAPEAPELVLLTPEPENETPTDDPSPAPTGTPAPTAAPTATPRPTATPVPLDEHGSYTHKEDVALFIHIFGRLPDNFITKTKARKLGWTGGSLEPYAPGKCIGGGEYMNLEGRLPPAPGRIWHECDIDTLGKKSRGAKRIVFSNDGLIYYTADHYETFTPILFGEE